MLVHGFVVDADPQRLDALCHGRFGRPSGGAVDIVALVPRVVLTWGFDPAGRCRSAAAWIPVAVAGRRDQGRIVARSYAAVSAFGWRDGATVSIDATGRRSWRVAGEQPAFTISERGRPATGAGRWHADVIGLGREVVGRFSGHGGHPRVVPGLQLAGDLAADLVAQRFRRVVAEGGDARGDWRVLEQLVGVAGMRARSRPADLELVVHDDGLRDMLGLHDQRLTLGYELEADLTVRSADPLWPLAA